MKTYISLHDRKDTAGGIENDALIGSTKITLENRILSEEWMKVNINGSAPIEQRALFHPSSSLPQGEISMWLGILLQL